VGTAGGGGDGFEGVCWVVGYDKPWGCCHERFLRSSVINEHSGHTQVTDYRRRSTLRYMHVCLACESLEPRLVTLPKNRAGRAPAVNFIPCTRASFSCFHQPEHLPLFLESLRVIYSIKRVTHHIHQAQQLSRSGSDDLKVLTARPPFTPETLPYEGTVSVLPPLVPLTRISCVQKIFFGSAASQRSEQTLLPLPTMTTPGTNLHRQATITRATC